MSNIEMTIEEELEIVENNINEYGICDVTLKEWNALKDGAYADGVLAGIELGKKETIDGILALIDKACDVHESLMNKSWEVLNKTDKEHLSAMHLNAIAYFEQRYLQFKYEFRNLIQNYAEGEKAETESDNPYQE